MKKTITTIKKLYSMIAVCTVILLTVILPQSILAQCTNDNIAPTINCPGNITMNATTNTCARVVNFATPAASDNCGTTSTVIWVINNVTFSGGGTASGYFVFNAGTNTITDWSVSVSGGNTGTFPVLTYSPSNSTASNFGNIVFFGLNTSSRELRFETASPKTNSGGTLPLDIAGHPNTNIECFNCTPFRFISGGSITGTKSLTVTQTAGLPSGSNFPLGTTTNTFKATDAAGNSTSCSFSVIINDAQPPSVSCPPNVVVSTDPGKCFAKVTFPSTMVLQYNPTGPQISTTPVPPSFQAANFTASDLSQVGANSGWTNTDVWPVGQISSSETPVPNEYVSFQVTVPNGTDFARLQYSKATYLGTGATFASIRSSLDGFTNDINSIPVNTAAGYEELVFDLGSMPFVSGSVEFRIYFYGASADKTDWADLASTNRGQNGLRLYVNNLATGSDNCGPVSITYSNFSNNYIYNKGTTTITATATDASNNSVSCHFTITVNDNEPPTITCPTNVNVQCASQVPAPNPGSITAADNCPGVNVSWVSDNITPGSCANRFTIARTYKATDASNNSTLCTQTITVFDNTPPMIACPQPITVQCSSAVPPPAPTTISAGDNCGPATVTWVSDVVSNQTCPQRYTITRTYKATDPCGNSATCTQIITVFDNTPPTITCPQTVTVKCSGQVPAPDPGSIVASDNCSGIVHVTWEGDVITNQTCANRYTITRTYKATDECGNSAACTQMIVVNDDVLPMITCPPAVTVQCAGDVPPPAPSTVTATDNCGAVTVTWAGDIRIPGNCPNRFTITRTYRATDACGNSATCTQIITVNDNTPPTITCPQPVTVQCASAVPPPAPNTIVASDNCGQVTVFWANDVINNQTCPNRYTISRIYIAVDACGNSTICTQTITVNDNTAPIVTCPPAVTVQCASAVPQPAPGTLTAIDNCSGPVTITWGGDVISNQVCANRYTITRTYKATDACGNTGTCTQIITVNDNTPPTFTCPPNKTILFSGPCTYNAAPTNTGSPTNVADNCGQVAVTFTDAVSTCGYNVTITRTWKATDVCGNSSTCVQTITVTDNNTPYIIYATKEAKFGENNDVNGDVGVTDANGKAEFKKNDVLDPYHVYAKNITVQMPATVNNKHFVPATGGPNPPFMTYAGTGGSGNFTQSVNGTVTGNYKDLTIKKNVVATVTGNDFGHLNIEEGADVTFTAGSINVQNLEMKNGKKNTTITKIRFSTCTGVMVRDKVSVGDDCNVNVGGPKVIFYMGDNKDDPENFDVHGNNTQVTANIVIPHGDLHVSGGEENNCIMTGWFVIEKLNSDGKNVIWNKYDCSTPAPITQPITSREAKPEEQPIFQVKVYPNPSASDFSIQVISTSTESISVRIIDVNGIVLKSNPPVIKGSLVKLGSDLYTGVYFAEVTQGQNRQTVKLVKVN